MNEIDPAIIDAVEFYANSTGNNYNNNDIIDEIATTYGTLNATPDGALAEIANKHKRAERDGNQAPIHVRDPDDHPDAVWDAGKDDELDNIKRCPNCGMDLTTETPDTNVQVADNPDEFTTPHQD